MAGTKRKVTDGEYGMNPQFFADLHKVTLTENIVQASSHPVECRCDACLEWWAATGGYGGPFSETEIRAWKARNG